MKKLLFLSLLSFLTVLLQAQTETIKVDSLKVSIPVGKNLSIGHEDPQVALDVEGGIKVGDTDTAQAGVFRYKNRDFEGFVDGEWKSFTSGTEITEVDTASMIILPNDPALQKAFGNSIDILGELCIVGDDFDDELAENAGAAYVFENTGTSWNQIIKLTASDGATSELFGRDVVMNENQIIVSAYLDGDQGTAAGAVYIFEKIGGIWSEVDQLYASDAGPDDNFGSSIDLFEDRLVVGAFGAKNAGINTGAVYIFEFINGSWIEKQKLLASDGAAFDRFGHEVSIDGDNLAVGRRRVSASGAAYVFKYNGSSWVETQKLIPSSGNYNDFFGATVELFGTDLFIGATGTWTTGIGSGAVYHYQLNGNNWEEKQKIVPLINSGNYGESILLFENLLLLSAGNSITNFNYQSGKYVEQLKWAPMEITGSNFFGRGMAKSADKIVITAPKFGSYGGAAFIFNPGADNNSYNELQTISKSGNIISLSNGGGSFTDQVNDADADPTNELQTITKNLNTVTLSDSGGSFIDEVDDADADPTNELVNNLILAGNDLQLTDAGGLKTVDLSGLSIMSDEIKDADQNTRIQVEEFANENVIRFDIDGDEKLRFQKNSYGQLLIEPTDLSANVFIGNNAGLNTNGTFGNTNVFIGSLAGTTNNIGSHNTALGYSAGRDLTSNRNTLVGYSAGVALGSGTENTFVGYFEDSQTSGSENTHLGSLAGNNRTGGDSNTFIGYRAGYNSGSGSGNVYIGHEAGYNYLGNNNLIIDNSSAVEPLIFGDFDTDIIKMNAQVSIGNYPPSAKLLIDADTSEDALRVRVNTSTKLWVHSNGGIRNTATTPTFAFQLQNSATDLFGRGLAFSWNTYSDRRIKSNFQNIQYGLQEVMQLLPQSYDHHNTEYFEDGTVNLKDENSTPDIGLVAQDVFEIIPEAVSPPANDQELWTMDYTRLVPVLIKAIQEQQTTINTLTEKIDRLEALSQE